MHRSAFHERLHRRLLARRAGVQRMPERNDALAVVAGDDRGVERLGQRDHLGGGACARRRRRSWGPRTGQQPGTRAIAAGSGAGGATRRDPGVHPIDGAASTSIEASIMAGPGRSAMAVNASSTAAASASGVRGRAWLARDARKRRRLAAVSCIQPRGAGVAEDLGGDVQHAADEASASPMPANALNAPGPVEVMHTPRGQRCARRPGGEGGRLLVADDDHPDRTSRQRVPHGQRVLAGNAEDDLDAVRLERLDQRPGTRFATRL